MERFFWNNLNYKLTILLNYYCFVLKNFDLADGFLNREEFRKGILLGYWERQVNGMNVVDDDSINRKSDRWGNNGKLDIDCQELLNMYDKQQ